MTETEHTNVDENADWAPATLNSYIDTQRNRIFEAQGIVGTVRAAITKAESWDGTSNGLLTDCRSALNAVHTLLEDICTKLDPANIEDPRLERTTDGGMTS